MGACAAAGGWRKPGRRRGAGAGVAGTGWGRRDSTAAAAAVVVVVAVLCAAGVDGAVPVTAHSHFRYGTISWEAGSAANEAIFTVNAAFRKEYNWGAYFKEQWRDTRKGVAWSSALGTSKLPCYNPSEVTQQNPAVQCFDQLSYVDFAGNYQILLPAGMGPAGYDLIPNTDGKDAYAYNASVGQKTRDPTVADAAENVGGKVCTCRFHKGVKAIDVSCQGTDQKSPYVEAKTAGLDDPPFGLGTVATGVANSDIRTCTPWSDAYGFFFGDDTFNSAGLVMDISEVVHETGLLGNMIRMRSQKFSHVYPSATAPGRGVLTIQSKHSTVGESHPPPRVCISIHPEG